MSVVAMVFSVIGGVTAAFAVGMMVFMIVATHERVREIHEKMFGKDSK